MSRAAVLEEPEVLGLERKPLKKAVWFITLRCNMNCPYCHAAQVRDPLLRHPFEAPEKWIDELSALELDRAFYLCTGHEPAELHYRVLGRVRESLTILYSERDPLSPRG